MRRGLASLLLLVCCACGATRGVYHSLPMPRDAAPIADGVAMSTFDDLANAAVVFGDGRVTLASVWRSGAPSLAAIERALGMQRELAATLRSRLPTLPPLRQWPVEWVGIDADEALRQRALGEQAPPR